MWTSILSLVIGGLPAIVKALGQAKHDALNATTEQERIAAQERVKSLEIQRDALAKEKESPWSTVARLAILSPFVIWLWSSVAYDKVLCNWWFGGDVPRCSTPQLSDWQYSLFLIAVGFYFVTSVTKAIKR